MTKQNLSLDNITRLGSALLGTLVFIYASYRSVILDFTHDESSTFLKSVQLSVWEIISYQNAGDANNHILNTLLMKLSNAIFGPQEWALRLPNILAHGLFVLFSYFIVQRTLSKSFVALLTFALINLNPYLLDFFSVARGYGLGMGLMMASLYFFQKYLSEKRMIFWIIALMCAILSV